MYYVCIVFSGPGDGTDIRQHVDFATDKSFYSPVHKAAHLSS